MILQFKRLANIYFLIIAILQTIPAISPLAPFIAWAPLIFVLSISMLREAYEDFQRYKMDNEMNYETHTHIRRNGEFVKVEWSKVVVGDICRVEQQELFPADMILLNSAIEGGVAFIETASLDGQKNLKPRNAYKANIQSVGDGSNSALINSLNGSWKGIPPSK